MFTMLSKMFGSTTKTPVAARADATLQSKPKLETLEERQVMSATVISGDLYIYGNNANNTVTVNYQTYSGVGYFKITENGANSYIAASRVTGGDVAFYGYDGNDYFNNNTGLRTYAWGMNGNDTLLGSYNADVLDGGAGSDHLYGYGGNDKLTAGYDYSYNYMDGGTGNDSLYGGWGVDHMYGNSGNDYLAASWGNDYLSGGTGTDWLYGEQGNDTLNGGDDGVSDYLVGGAGADQFQIDFLYGRFRNNRDTMADFSTWAGDSTYNV